MLPLPGMQKHVTVVIGHGDEPSDGMMDDELHAISGELIEAVHSRDVAGVASALEAAFAYCDMQPHEEGEHPEGEG